MRVCYQLLLLERVFRILLWMSPMYSIIPDLSGTAGSDSSVLELISLCFFAPLRFVIGRFRGGKYVNEHLSRFICNRLEIM